MTPGPSSLQASRHGLGGLWGPAIRSIPPHPEFPVPCLLREPTTTDAEPDALSAGFRDRDEWAIREVVRQYGGPMTAVARRMMRDRHRADDAVQQALVQAWRAADSFDPRRPLGPWLFTITRRVCIDLHRVDRRAALPDADAAAQADSAVEPFSVEASWLRWEVRRAIDGLPAEEKVVVELQHLEGLTHREIGCRLGLPLGTVKSRSWRAHRRLSGLLGDTVRPH
jgi:RNA polymerase sigma-70 factor (ECF subfamily)